MNDPKILILDEPTAGLDPKERVKFRNIIAHLSKDRTVILSTHIVSDIESIANQVIMIKDHKILCQASPKVICKELQGRVFEGPESLIKDKKPFLLTEWQEEGQMFVRFIGEKTQGNQEGIISRTPNLEDVFLYVYRDEETSPNQSV